MASHSFKIASASQTRQALAEEFGLPFTYQESSVPGIIHKQQKGASIAGLDGAHVIEIDQHVAPRSEEASRC